ncbi:MAG TPA: tRNA uridine-5-carboxymethylaminomethyl(34) synthesis GTPase MnmE [Nitrospira sp.]|nr:tRNA uridine-5-carboxymethylaminomethyl(34) synthesis GTPase MnmE [Nitrospira sp.]
MRGAADDTICAIATPLGEGGIGIVRVSGPQAVPVADAVLTLRSRQPLASVPSHTLHLADVSMHPSTLGAPPIDGQAAALVDEALVVYMKAPRSFTGEDVVEIHSHGGGLVLSLVCQACINAGARLAEPGEFTKRAFLHGRLDLSQAEAVLDTIHAKSLAALTAAQRQLRGDLSQEVELARAALVHLLAQVEAGIDFVEEDIVFLDRPQLRDGVESVLTTIRRLESSFQAGRILREGARVAILGRPNVGKSSLLNRLLKEERAIVSPVPGTTRDVIQESVQWDGVRLHLVDTAGIHASDDLVEREGIRRSVQEQAQADLQVVVLDGNQPLTADDRALIRAASQRRHVLAVNKSDLPAAFDLRLLGSDSIVSRVSALTGAGTDELRSDIRRQLITGGGDATQGTIVTSLRHRTALQRARQSLEHGAHSIDEQLAVELLCIDLRAAADALGEITGAITTEEILDQIFAQFCIGK